MTEGQVGESYTELGGQLPDETERERGLRRIADLREALERGEKPCGHCGHPARHHGTSGACYYPTAPRGEDCPCGHTKETDS